MKKVSIILIIAASYWMLHICYSTYKRLFVDWEYWENHLFELVGWTLYLIVPFSILKLGIYFYDNHKKL